MSPRAASNNIRLRPLADAEQPLTPLRRAVLQSLALAGVATALTTAADAAPIVRSIAIKFATEQPGRATLPTVGGDAESFVNAPAGVLNTVNWNNFSGQSQLVPQTLTVDLNSGSLASTATVTWSSNNTWSSTGLGEENNTAQNTATNESADLMAGYLDTGGVGGVGVTINVTGLNTSGFTLGYDVYVYIQGGVNDRGGLYTLGAVTDTHTATSAFDGTFLEDTDLAGTTFGSNYIVFRNVTGDSFALTTTPTIGGTARAPINAIEIVAIVPEPSAAMALAGGIGLLLGWHRLRRS